MKQAAVGVRLLCFGCHRSIQTLDMECSDDFAWLIIKCPNCQCQIGQLLVRDVHNTRSLSYERFLYSLDAIIRVDGNVVGRGLKELRRKSARTLAGVILSRDNVQRVTHEAFAKRARTEQDAALRKGAG